MASVTRLEWDGLPIEHFVLLHLATFQTSAVPEQIWKATGLSVIIVRDVLENAVDVGFASKVTTNGADHYSLSGAGFEVLRDSWERHDKLYHSARQHG